jgi:putative copper export protein
MLSSAGLLAWSLWIALWKLDVTFAGGAESIEQIVLRWVHIVAGIYWIGFLSFFLLAMAPALKSLDPATRERFSRRWPRGGCGGSAGAPW